MERLAIGTDSCLVERDAHRLLVTLNRPEAKNAFNPAMLVGMYRAWRLLDSDDTLRCAVLTARGDTFCAGMDLKAGPEGGDDTAGIRALMQEVPNLHWQALLRDDRPGKPIVLAVEGYALAGGTEILQGTDIRVAAEDAVFGVTEVARGLYPMAGSTIRLRRQIPYCLAAEILLTGRHVTAAEALDWGLINRIVPAGCALEEALKIAAQIAANAPLAVRAVMRSLRGHEECLPESEAMRRSDELGWPVFASEDAREGMLAFRERRAPVFRGV